MPTSKEQFRPELTEIEKEQARQPTRLSSKKMLAALKNARAQTTKKPPPGAGSHS